MTTPRKPRAPRICRTVGCDEVVPLDRRPQAAYCSPRCKAKHDQRQHRAKKKA